MAMDETSGEMPIDEDTTIESINEILKDLMDSNVWNFWEFDYCCNSTFWR